MAQVLSLKELRSSSTLKEEIRKAEDEKQQLLDQLDRQKLLEKKLRDDLINQKKDFDHLEKQFDHFAGIESDFDALQQEVQMERLEKMITDDKKDIHSKQLVQKSKGDLKGLQSELKELKKLDPQRLKRQVTDLKKKTQQQATDNKNINSSLVSARKELKEMTAEKEQLDLSLKASLNRTDYFWQDKNKNWALYDSTAILKNEDLELESKRVLCLNTQTGVSVFSTALGDDDKAVWLGDIEIPDEASIEAGKRLKNIASELEDED